MRRMIYEDHFQPRIQRGALLALRHRKLGLSARQCASSTTLRHLAYLSLILAALSQTSCKHGPKRYGGESPVCLTVHFESGRVLNLKSTETQWGAYEFSCPLLGWAPEKRNEILTSESYLPVDVVSILDMRCSFIRKSYIIDSVARIVLGDRPSDSSSRFAGTGEVEIFLRNGTSVSGRSRMINIIGNDGDGTETRLTCYSETWDSLLFIDVQHDTVAEKLKRRRTYPISHTTTSAIVAFKDGSELRLSDLKAPRFGVISASDAEGFMKFHSVTDINIGERSDDGRPWSTPIRNVKRLQYQGVDAAYPGENYNTRITVTLSDGKSVKGYDSELFPGLRGVGADGALIEISPDIGESSCMATVSYIDFFYAP